MEKVWEALRDGAPFSFVNLAVLALVLAIIAERSVYILTKYRVNSREFMAQIRKLVQAGNNDRAVKLCEAAPLPLLQVVKAGLPQVRCGRFQGGADERAEAEAREAHRFALVAREHRDAHRSAWHHLRSDSRVRGRRVRRALGEVDTARQGHLGSHVQHRARPGHRGRVHALPPGAPRTAEEDPQRHGAQHHEARESAYA